MVEAGASRRIFNTCQAISQDYRRVIALAVERNNANYYYWIMKYKKNVVNKKRIRENELPAGDGPIRRLNLADKIRTRDLVVLANESVEIHGGSKFP